jgi:hypothetical protein
LRPQSSCRLREIAAIVLRTVVRDRAMMSVLLMTSAREPAASLADCDARLSTSRRTIARPVVQLLF